MQPTDEQLAKWESDWLSERENADVLLIQAFQAGADAELEACREWLREGKHHGFGYAYGAELASRYVAARRPKPPSLKQQALLQLDTLNADLAMHGKGCDLSQIRRALEALPDA